MKNAETKSPPKHRVVNKSNMDQPQEEFIEESATEPPQPDAEKQPKQQPETVRAADED